MPRVLSADDVASFRVRLCEAAERRFAEKGPASVTMRQLAADLGCSPMTPYRYFKDKDEILAAVRTAAFDRFADALEAAFHGAIDPKARSQAVGLAYVRFALAQPQAYRLMFDLMQPGEKAYPDLVRATERARATMTDHLRSFEGETRAEAEAVGHIYWASIHGILMLHLAGKLAPKIELSGLIERMMKTIHAGVLASD